MIEHQDEAVNSHRYEMVDLMQGFINSLEGRRAGYKRKVRSTIRSFFAHNRTELPKDPRFIIRTDVQRVVGTLTLDEARRVILAVNPAYKAIFLSMLQGGMGKAEFEYWNLNGWESLKKQLRDDPRVIRVDLPGRKKARNIRPYFTLLGGDASEAIRNWLQHRPEKIPTYHSDDMRKDPEKRRILKEELNTAIFTNKYHTPILADAAAVYWTRFCKRLGIVPKEEGASRGSRYGKNLHELRTLFRSQWEKAPNIKVSVAEYLMGHEVDPLDYNQAFRDEDWTRKEYLKALPMLQIISSGKPFGQVQEDEVVHLNGRIKDLEAEVDQLRSNKNTEVASLRRDVAELRAMLKLIYNDPELAKRLKSEQ
jgi:integrase